MATEEHLGWDHPTVPLAPVSEAKTDTSVASVRSELACGDGGPGAVDGNGRPQGPLQRSRGDWDYPTVPTSRKSILGEVVETPIGPAVPANADPDEKWLAGDQEAGPTLAQPQALSRTVARRLAHAVRDLCETIVPAIIIALLINLFLAQATRVYGQSMEPSLHTNQRLVVEKVSYNPWLNLRPPQRGDVVVVRVEGNPELLIKRVVGLPGDRVQISGGQLYINGQAVVESYIARPALGDFGPVDVPPLTLFVLGDNRNFSNDSRVFGPVPMDNVVGRAWLSYWPPEWWGAVQ